MNFSQKHQVCYFFLSTNIYSTQSCETRFVHFSWKAEVVLTDGLFSGFRLTSWLKMQSADSTSAPQSSWTFSCRSASTFSTSGESVQKCCVWSSVPETFPHLCCFKPATWFWLTHICGRSLGIVRVKKGTSSLVFFFFFHFKIKCEKTSNLFVF